MDAEAEVRTKKKEKAPQKFPANFFRFNRSSQRVQRLPNTNRNLVNQINLRRDAQMDIEEEENKSDDE